LSNETYNKHKFRILWKLSHHHYWGKRHTPIENVPKGLPPHEYGLCRDVIEELIKNRWIIKKKTGHGLDIYLNPRFSKEIREFLEKYSTLLRA